LTSGASEGRSSATRAWQLLIATLWKANALIILSLCRKQLRAAAANAAVGA